MKMDVIQWKGKPISVPGIYVGVPMDFYHSAEACVGPSVSSSGLRTILKESPAHYWAESPYNTQRTEDEEDRKKKNADKVAFILGRAAHHLLLGEGNFKKHFVQRPSRYADWKTLESKAWRAEMQEIGKTVLISSQLDQIRGMMMALVKSPLINPPRGSGLLTGHIEHSFFWKHQATGLWLKARPDAVPIDWQSFADLKTCRAIDLRSITKSIYDYRYDVQAALIRKLAREIGGVDIGEFYFVFVTTKPPYLVQTVTVDPRRMDEADRDIEVALRVFARSWVNKEWLGPNGTQLDLHTVTFTEWQEGEAKFRREFLEQELRLAGTSKVKGRGKNEPFAV